MEVEEEDMARVALVVAQEVGLVRVVVKSVLGQDWVQATMEAVAVVLEVAMEVAAVEAAAEDSLLMEEARLVDVEAVLAVDMASVLAEGTEVALGE